jgi:DHA2 family multidrug resistance protein
LFSGTLWLTFLVLIYRMSFGCVHSPLTKMILSTLPPDRLSMGSGLDGIHRGFASAFGIALGSVILERRTAMHVISLSETHELSTTSVQEAIDATAITLQQTGLSVTDPERHPLLVLWWQLLEQARVLAYQETFLVLSGVTLLALLPAIWARREKP